MDSFLFFLNFFSLFSCVVTKLFVIFTFTRRKKTVSAINPSFFNVNDFDQTSESCTISVSSNKFEIVYATSIILDKCIRLTTVPLSSLYSSLIEYPLEGKNLLFKHLKLTLSEIRRQECCTVGFLSNETKEDL